jgi:translocation and assembly module TamB
VKRGLKYGIIAAILVIVVLSLAVSGWLLGTTDGARWLMDAVSRHTTYTISARQVEGELGKDLRLDGLRLHWPQGDITAGSLRLRWHPLLLLTGRLAIKDIVLKDASMIDGRPKSTVPLDLTWPKVTGVPAWLNTRIGKLQIDGLRYQRLSEKAVIVNNIIFDRTRLRASVLTVRRLEISMPSMRVDGAITAGFRKPSLLLNLTALPATPMAGFDKLTLDARLLPASDPEQAAGPVRIAGLSGSKQLMTLNGELGVTRNSFLLRKIDLRQPGRWGVVNGEGVLAFLKAGDKISLRLGFSDVDLSPELKGGASLSGALDFEGFPESYQGRFALSGKGEGWRKGSLAGTFRGDLNKIAFDGLKGSLLSGTAGGSAGIDWAKGLLVNVNLSGRGLDPGEINPEWSGAVNAELKGAAEWSKGSLKRAEIKGRLMDSRLMGRSLTGEADVRLVRKNIFIDRLFVNGKGFELRASGELEKKVSFAASIYDLSGLVPGSAGSLRAEGWLRRKDDRVSGAVKATGRKLSVNDVKIASADIDARVSDTEGYPLSAAVNLRGASYGDMRMESANLKVGGNLERHTIEAQLRSPGFEVRTALNGSFNGKVWQGEISRLSGRDSVGPWRLLAPAALRVSADSISLPRLAIGGARGEYLETGSDVNLGPLRGSVRMEWRSLNLGRFTPLLGEVRVNGFSSGTVQVRLPGGDRIVVTGRADASGEISAHDHRLAIRQASVQVNWNERGMLTLLDLTLAEGGTLKGRFSSTQPARMAVPSRGELEADLQGFDLALLHPWLPSGFDLEGRLEGKVRGQLSPGMQLDVRGNVQVVRGTLRWREEGDQLNAAIHRADVSLTWQGGKGVAGRGIGSLQTRSVALNGTIEASGAAVVGGHPITIQRTSLRLDWGERGMNTALDIKLADGGTLQGTFFSPLPAGTEIPSQGVINAEWKNIDLVLLHPWLPAGFDPEGSLSGRVAGSLLPERHIDLQGNASISRGSVRWRKENGEFSARLSKAEITWTWRGDKLAGDVSLALEEYGQARGSFQLPLPASLPVAVKPSGPVMLSVSGRAREKGLLSSLFPGLVRESKGKLDFKVLADGKWEKPRLSGNFSLTEAGAYLPAPGITLKDVQMNVILEQDKIRIESLRITSGAGHLEGTAVVQLKDWQVADYNGKIKGDRFQIVYLPELQVSASPDLNFSGTTKKLKVRGDIRIPELLVLGRAADRPIAASNDVIIVGEKKPVEKEAPLALDVQVAVILGDKVLIKAEGIDAQLKGKLNLAVRKLDDIRSTGQIRVVKGRYKAYGINLDITRGRIFYAGGRINEPTLDILALRRVNDVRAGVAIVGTPQTMIVKLYSEPPLPDNVILSYIVLGQPLAFNEEQSGQLTQAAGQLSSTSMGYRPIQTGPSRSTAGGGVSQSMLSVGRYLTPDLYVSFGRSLITGSNLLRVRYSPTKSWEFETQAGTESGGDVFYRISFD